MGDRSATFEPWREGPRTQVERIKQIMLTQEVIDPRHKLQQNLNVLSRVGQLFLGQLLRTPVRGLLLFG